MANNGTRKLFFKAKILEIEKNVWQNGTQLFFNVTGQVDKQDLKFIFETNLFFDFLREGRTYLFNYYGYMQKSQQSTVIRFDKTDN